MQLAFYEIISGIFVPSSATSILAASAGSKPSNGIIAIIMISVFIASAAISALITHKLKKNKTGSAKGTASCTPPSKADTDQHSV